MKQRHLSVILGGLLVLLFTGLMFSCQGTNDSVAVASVSIDGGDTEATVGTPKTLTASVAPPTAANQSVTWESSDETVATIDTAGVVTPKKVGTTTITVTTTDGNYTNTITLTVNAASVTKLSGYTKISVAVNTKIEDQTPTVTPAEATGTYAIEPPLPAGLSLDTDTGKLSGTPTEGSASDTYTITFTATASGNYKGTAFQEITIAVLMADASPGAPTIGTLTAGDSQVTVSWTAPTDTGYNDGVAATIDGYTVYYSKAENFTKVEDFTKDTADGNRSTNDGTTEIVVDGLTNEATYYFLVTATNDTGEGGSSVVMSFAPAGYTVGDTGPAGGIVFYVKNVYLDVDDWRYLEAPTSDQSTGTGIAWGGSGTEVGGTSTDRISTAIGTGKANTDQIVSVLTTTEGIERTTYAAGVCSEYSTTVEGTTFDDWFLPSKDELNELYKQRATVGGFVDSGIYWSSSEGSSNLVASAQQFSEGEQSDYFRHFDSYVRAIRAF